jgi:saxitoxin biosynthesis operon SxtJ-like protein
MTLDDETVGATDRERRVFSLTLIALAIAVALIIWFKPASLLFIACFTGLAWCASMLFNGDEPSRLQLKGAAFPIVMAVAYYAAVHLDARAAVACILAGALVILSVLVSVRAEFGRRFYTGWMQAFKPLAWSVSTLLLVLLYYGVFTPIGLAMRVFGRDPMRRNFDRAATSYWIRRTQANNTDRYFRQF